MPVAGSKWSSLTKSCTRCLIVLLMLQSSQILGKDAKNLNIGYTWVRGDIRQGVPPNAIVGGYSHDGPTIYVGRALHEDNLLPAKVSAVKKIAYVSYNGKEYLKYDVEVLVGTSSTFSWNFGSNGYAPPDAVVGGHTSIGETLYIGRALYNGSLVVGKIQQSKRGLLLPYGGLEQFFPAYEVLVHN